MHLVLSLKHSCRPHRFTALTLLQVIFTMNNTSRGNLVISKVTWYIAFKQVNSGHFAFRDFKCINNFHQGF